MAFHWGQLFGHVRIMVDDVQVVKKNKPLGLRSPRTKKFEFLGRSVRGTRRRDREDEKACPRRGAKATVPGARGWHRGRGILSSTVRLLHRGHDVSYLDHRHGFGSRVVAGCYEEAGMSVQVVSPRAAWAVRSLCAGPFDLVSAHSPPFSARGSTSISPWTTTMPSCATSLSASRPTRRGRCWSGRATWASCTFSILNSDIDPGRRRVKEIIDSGAIGRVVHMNWNF